MGKEQNSNFYDEIYKSGGSEQLYFKPAKSIKYYYPTWEYSYKYLIENNVKSIIDLGCGPGHFASLFNSQDNIMYMGYDFSEEAIKQSISRNKSNPNIKFKTQNLNYINLSGIDTFYTSFEFLEHISFDLEILEKIKKENHILFSVPNYDSKGHVRWFKSFLEIKKRYSEILELSLIHEISISSNNKIYLCHGIRK
jgi:2-polyprenyl-3-methyl-5-hydroxy-6-metoxy-1,4-benzoquinol methylase